jgi:hypothetical protein
MFLIFYNMEGVNMKKKICFSTHGGAGYSFGDYLVIYRDKNQPNIDRRAEFTCGECGYKGKARPTGGKTHYYEFKENPVKWIKQEVKYEEPTWPDFLSRGYIYI